MKNIIRLFRKLRFRIIEIQTPFPFNVKTGHYAIKGFFFEYNGLTDADLTYEEAQECLKTIINYPTYLPNNFGYCH